MNPIVSALASKVPVDSIIEYLVTRYPHMREKVAFAMDSGYNVNDILKMLKSYDKKGFKRAVETTIPKKEKERIQFSNQRRDRNLTLAEEAQSQEMQTIEKRKDQLKSVGKAALGVGGLYASSRIIPYITKRLAPIAEQGIEAISDFISKRGTPSPGPQAQVQQPSIEAQPQPQPAPPMGQGTPQQPGPFTPPQAMAPNPKATDLINQLGIGHVIEGLSSKENPQTIAQVVEQHFMKPGQKKWLSEQTPDTLEKLVGDYLSQKPKEAPQQKAVPSEPIEEQKTLSLTPSGDIGSIDTESKGVATIDVDGKKKQFREQDIIKAPIPEKDMADIYEELIGKIPESERSAIINVAGYDPNHNELIFMPHDEKAALYVYSQIPPEYAEKLKNAMFKAKTTGENLYGAWSEGESSRGAGLYQLIKELQQLYGGKGKEYVRKYEKIYDFLALPKAALKEKEKKKREEERTRQGKKSRKPRSS